MTNNKITLAMIIALAIIFSITLINLNNKLDAITFPTDISSSTVKVGTGTTTLDVPIVNVFNVQQNQINALANLYCASNPTAENCNPAK